MRDGKVRGSRKACIHGVRSYRAMTESSKTPHVRSSSLHYRFLLKRWQYSLEISSFSPRTRGCADAQAPPLCRFVINVPWRWRRWPEASTTLSPTDRGVTTSSGTPPTRQLDARAVGLRQAEIDSAASPGAVRGAVAQPVRAAARSEWSKCRFMRCARWWRSGRRLALRGRETALELRFVGRAVELGAACTSISIPVG